MSVTQLVLVICHTFLDKTYFRAYIILLVPCKPPQIPIIIMITVQVCYIYMTCYFVRNLAKLLYGITTWAFILFGHVACRDLELTVAPHAGVCPG